MPGESSHNDRVSTFIAILIAVVSVIAALGAWRVAVATSNASSADTDGLLAQVDRENALTSADTTVTGRLYAYARATADDTIAKALEPLESSTTDATLKAQIKQERDNRIYAANQLRFSIPQQYIDRNQKYDSERDLGETAANLSLDRDTFPDSHFESADAERAKANWLLVFLVVLGIAFVFLTLADAVKNPLRYALIAAAILMLLLAVVGGVLAETAVILT